VNDRRSSLSFHRFCHVVTDLLDFLYLRVLSYLTDQKVVRLLFNHVKLLYKTACVNILLQIADLSAGELKWLANHMGHDLNIHESVYRIHDSTIELAKISRLLMAVDSGVVNEFAGKRLDQINLGGKFIRFSCAIFGLKSETSMCCALYHC
jgi:hypothetical protein